MVILTKAAAIGLGIYDGWVEYKRSRNDSQILFEKEAGDRVDGHGPFSRGTIRCKTIPQAKSCEYTGRWIAGEAISQDVPLASCSSPLR